MDRQEETAKLATRTAAAISALIELHEQLPAEVSALSLTIIYADGQRLTMAAGRGPKAKPAPVDPFKGARHV